MNAGAFIDGITNENMASTVIQASTDNFFMYAFIVFALIMITGIVAIVTVFIRKDIKKDLRQNEQYKSLVDSQSKQYGELLKGYNKMIDENSKTNSEFRNTIADIGTVLRELTGVISRNEANFKSNEEKIELILSRIDHIKKDISNSNGKLYQAFREYETNRSNSQNSLERTLDRLVLELHRNTDWCMNVHDMDNTKGSD